MQDHTILPELKIKPGEFWDRVKAERTENRSVEVDTQDPLLHKPGPSASLLPTANGKLGAAPGLCLTLFFSVL